MTFAPLRNAHSNDDMRLIPFLDLPVHLEVSSILELLQWLCIVYIDTLQQDQCTKNENERFFGNDKRFAKKVQIYWIS